MADSVNVTVTVTSPIGNFFYVMLTFTQLLNAKLTFTQWLWQWLSLTKTIKIMSRHGKSKSKDINDGHEDVTAMVMLSSC
jgi:hypothetical protein